MLNKKILTETETWHIAAEAFHTDDFRAKYINGLEYAIRNKDLTILDTAAGNGFPTTDLYHAGFKNIEASDSDEKSVNLLREFFQNGGLSIPVSEGKWQELSQKIQKQFDVVINMDNSFVYMDGWTDTGIFANGNEQVFGRISLILKNFYEVLHEDGFVILGLGRHYHPGTKEYSLTLKYSKNNIKADIEWYGKMNWETRENRWTVKVNGEDFHGEFLKRSYCITKEETAEILKRVGFQKVHIIDPDSAGNIFIVGLKSGKII